MIGGLWGRTVYDWLFVELLFVPDALRGRGVGSELMQRAEDEALKRRLRVVVPVTRVAEQRLVLAELDQDEPLEPGPFGILEPSAATLRG